MTFLILTLSPQIEKAERITVYNALVLNLQKRWCLVQRKDTCNIAEEVLILEISLLANLTDGFQEQVLSPWPLLLEQYNHMAQRHVISVVCKSSQLQDKVLYRRNQSRKYITS